MKKVLILSLLLLLSSCSKVDKVEVTQSVPPDGGDTVITLSWVGPVEYTDGTPLPISAIGGYKIYWGNTSRKYNIKVEVPDNYADKYTFPKLEPNTYYLVITCYTEEGVEGGYSKEVTFTVN